MKLIISILMLPVVIMLSLAGLIYGFVRLLITRPFLQEPTATAHTVKGCLYVAIGCGLPLSVLVAAAGALLMICAFIFKSWTRAFFAAGAATLAVLMWLYYLNLQFPI